jgi:phosphatidylglycerol:prolipoprotein diacylglycerol transferase
MLPILFKLGPLEIPSFGVMLATGVLLAWFYFTRQFREDANKELLASLVTYAVLAGFLGSRLNYILENIDEIATWKDLAGMIFSRSGLVVYGGVICGALFAFYYSHKHNLPTRRVLDAGAPAICIGYFFGRIGCQLAGDGDYGIPSSLPWAMAYPNGTVPTLARVHPTPVYEMILISVIFLILLQLKKRNPAPGRLFAVFLVLAGIERFAIETIRINPRLLLGLTEAQIISILLVAGGLYMNFSTQRSQRREGEVVEIKK